MPQTYRVTTDQGTYNVTVDDPAPEPVERGGLRHPLTSVVAPELESMRGALESATATPHGQPIMARSRTGTLYPSETGTGAVNAAKNAAKGAGGALLDQVEGITSPVGLATSGAAKGAAMLAESPAARSALGRGLGFVSDFNLKKPFKSTVGPIADALQSSAENVPPVGVDRYMPNTGGMPTSATVRPASGRVPYASPPDNPVGMIRTQPTAGASSSLSDLELARQEVAAGRLPQSALSAIERAQQAPPRTPPGMMRTTQAPPTPITVRPDSAMQPDPVPAQSPLQQPRAQVGAEVVGRHNGMTTQQVRDTTGPIRGEAPGTAAGMPKGPMERILQKLIEMGPKGQGLPESAREAYAAAGTSDKTRVQVQAALDALRKIGFAGAGAALSREALLKQLQDDKN